VFKGYFSDDMDFFLTHQEFASGYSADLTGLSAATNGFLIESNTQVHVSAEWVGYILIPVDSGGLWSFTMVSDDSSYLWLGDNAISNYAASNAFMRLSGTHTSQQVSSSATLLEDVYYPIRIQYGQDLGAYNFILSLESPGGATVDGATLLYHGVQPTSAPSVLPSLGPTASPSFSSSSIPSVNPSTTPSYSPSRKPSSVCPS
jgi:hypothetical protein